MGYAEQKATDGEYRDIAHPINLGHGKDRDHYFRGLQEAMDWKKPSLNKT